MKVLVCVLALLVCAANSKSLEELRELEEEIQEEIMELEELEARHLVSKRGNLLGSDDFDAEKADKLSSNACPAGYKRFNVNFDHRGQMNCDQTDGNSMLDGASGNPVVIKVDGTKKFCFDFKGKTFMLRRASIRCIGVAQVKMRFCPEGATGCTGPTWNYDCPMKTMSDAYNACIAGPNSFKKAKRVIFTLSQSVFTTACKSIFVEGCVQE